jgi:light-regulated signal transduction histidine kinase (bacteriophytochrome)
MLSPLDTEEGLLLSSAIRDISERRRRELALQIANRELEAFSYSVAHDLRAPLRGMNGFAQILVDDYGDKLDDEGRDYLSEILQNAARMGALIDALLSLAGVTRRELKPEWVDLAAFSRTALGRLQADEPERQVEQIVHAPIEGHFDPSLARNLIENLLGNAWKFTSRVTGARIEVGSQLRDGERVCFVRDNGAGFDMAHAQKLFAPFQRLHSFSEFAGTGIGLATAQRILHRHGSRIWAEAAVGAGATFYFTLPPRPSGASS